MSTERKRGFTKPRGELPTSTSFAGIVYNDEDSRFRYVFTSPRSGHVEVSNEDGVWTNVVDYRKFRSKGWHGVLEDARNSAAGALVGSFEQLMIACAIDAAGGTDAVHYESEGNATLCGITTAWLSNRVRVRNTTSNVLKITCKECRFKLINAVNAMPFLEPESE